MLTYDKGQWSHDSTLSDDWRLSSSEGLVYPGYDKNLYQTFGIDYLFHAEVYHSNDEQAPYRFFVALDDPAHSAECVLVTDYPSLLMLLKEILPLIQFTYEQVKFEMLEEEHQWTAKGHELRTGEREICGHR